MFVADDAELVLPPLPPPPLPIFESRTAVPGTTVIVSEATAIDTPIEQRMNAKRRRRLNKTDCDEDLIFIGLVASSDLAIQNYQVNLLFAHYFERGLVEHTIFELFFVIRWLAQPVSATGPMTRRSCSQSRF